MSRLAAATLALTLTACATTDSPAALPPGTAPARGQTTSEPASPSTIRPLPTRSIRTSTPAHATAGPTTTSHALAGSAQSAARRVITQLIEKQTAGVPDEQLWADYLDGGSIIQTTTLAEAGGRATVAVSVAYESSERAEIVEPVGVRVELHHSATGWAVLGIGRL